MTILTVDVTQEDIDNGLRASAYSCPIARAITRVTGRSCLVDGTSVLFSYDQVRGTLPQRVTDFIEEYDDSTELQRELSNTGIIVPFKFSVELEDII